MVLAAGLFIALCMFWRSGSDLEITHHDIRRPSPATSFRVVQLSDLHLQRFGEAEKSIVTQVQTLQPDLVVLTGDAIDRADALPVLKDFLAALGSIHVVAVPGNWEHWSGVDFPALIALFADQPNGRFLFNERVSFTSGNRKIHLIGLDDFTAGQPDERLLSQAMSDDVTVLVQHSPGFFEVPEVNRRMSQQRFSLCLSGHTHGGQVSFGSWAPFTPVGSGRFVAGFYDVPSCRLYVSRGLGTSVLPLRWGAAPEIAVFDL
jgi:predicted MPP superfamily phosphohydrolase